ncbi:MAG: NRDE family protein [Pirellulales bacterium]|nr:NRDE family protein [Pirellulales bacterium]
MCLLAIQYRTLAAAPVLVAANREEFFDRPATVPAVDAGPPRVLCGRDQRAGGTWLGVNEHGLVVGVTNRLKSNLPAAPRSRGALCRELLDCTSAAEAIALAESELQSGKYAGANFLCVDRSHGAFVIGADHVEILPLLPGLHLVTNGDPNDVRDSRQTYARTLFAQRFPNSLEHFVGVSRDVLSRHSADIHQPTIVLRGPDRGTISSSIIGLAADPSQSVYLHAAGSPDQTEYADLSPLLRGMFVTSVAPAKKASAKGPRKPKPGSSGSRRR